MLHSNTKLLNVFNMDRIFLTQRFNFCSILFKLLFIYNKFPPLRSYILCTFKSISFVQFNGLREYIHNQLPYITFPFNSDSRKNRNVDAIDELND